MAIGRFDVDRRHSAKAQALYGSLVGNVTDPSSAGVPGASVKITQVETNESREGRQTTLAFSVFRRFRLEPTPWRSARTASRPRYEKDVVVRSNTVVRVDIALQVGTVNQNIEVTAAAALCKPTARTYGRK